MHSKILVAKQVIQLVTYSHFTKMLIKSGSIFFIAMFLEVLIDFESQVALVIRSLEIAVKILKAITEKFAQRLKAIKSALTVKTILETILAVKPRFAIIRAKFTFILGPQLFAFLREIIIDFENL
jgi:hypothetical protein